MKPNFLVIGAAKCGTTSLCSLLAQHPDVFICNPREPNFFAIHYERGWGWYEDLFSEATKHRAIGEGSTLYSIHAFYPDAAPRIHKCLPQVRIIYIVRHPMEQIESMWMYMRLLEAEALSLNQALQQNEVYLEIPRYLKQINVYREYFDESQILVLFLEDLKAYPQNVLNQCFQFLGVTPHKVVGEPHSRNATLNRYGDRRFTHYCRQIPGFERMSSFLWQFLPDAARRRLKSLFRYQFKNRPVWQPSTREWVISQIAENSKKFLRLYGKPSDFWRFDIDN